LIKFKLHTGFGRWQLYGSLKDYFLIFTLLTIFIFSAKSQNQSLYFSNAIPQGMSVNPSYFPGIELTFGIPLLSSYNFAAKSPFALKNLNYTKIADTGYFDLNDLISKSKTVNSLNIEGGIQILTIGYAIDNTYLMFDYSTKFNFDLRYPKDLLELIWKGNEAFIGKTADLDGLGINFSHYNEISLGAVQRITPEITAGGRFKYIQGLSNFNTTKSKITLHTDTTTYWLKGTADLALNMSGPFNLDSTYFSDAVGYLLGNYGNPGFGFDLGVAYQYGKQFNFAANVLDLGYIYWKKQISSYSMSNSDFSFNGFTIDSLTNFKNVKNFDSLITVFTDSIEGEFEVIKSSNKYRTGLYPKLYLSAEYLLDKQNRIGLLYYHKFMGNTGQNSITANYAHSFGKAFRTNINYTLNDFSRSGIGLGFDVKLGGFQMYMLCDNILPLFSASSVSSAHINFGFNYLIIRTRPVIRSYTPGYKYSKRELKGLEKKYKVDRKQDLDHDGIPDLVDKCPYDSGWSFSSGCPDADQDSTGDIYDLCPKTPGPVFNNGCPVIRSEDKQLLEMIMNLIEFKAGTDTLKTSANVYLDELSVLMQSEPGIMLKIDAHVYDMPTKTDNLKLSKDRANAIKKYLVDKGVAPKTIITSGQGSNNPLIDINDPANPVKKNRIELYLFYK
jgi:outer membrane protein OmpA-like peptidoglycan-associated protein